MTIDIEADARSVRDRPAIAAAMGRWLVLALLFGSALWLRHAVAANTDVSWLLTAADKVMTGGRLYVDVIETNPPIAVLAYMPALWLGRAFGVPAETVVDALMFLAIFGSLGIVIKILQPSSRLGDRPRWPLAWLGFAVASAIVGLVIGGLIAVVVPPVKRLFAKKA